MVVVDGAAAAFGLLTEKLLVICSMQSGGNALMLAGKGWPPR
jgi:hypothetical protein